MRGKILKYILSCLLLSAEVGIAFQNVASIGHYSVGKNPVTTGHSSIGASKLCMTPDPTKEDASVSVDFEDGNAEGGVDLSRRNLLYWPIGIGGAVVYGKLVAGTISKISRGELAYPEAHERRVQETISNALLAAIPKEATTKSLRVLEVGIGKECRLIRRGLYDKALEDLSSRGVSKLELVGVDIDVPSQDIRDEASRRIKDAAVKYGIDADLEVLQKSITSNLGFNDGWFDAVICSLTLCSVDDQEAALKEIKRLVRPTGGTFGYVEHVAVNSDEPYRLLELQQRAFDPLQQAVADNCHLHRSTDANVAKIFQVGDSNSHTVQIFKERFIVDGMWPVSCQACGVVQKI